ncbi:MAG: tRNA (adenosine(37)-N6)-threonylcarbamoyltransferase complex dimerization subunit type 1 TsaB [Henriciella sp.]|nr:tRNA (adenosine(37)-N6)-threonylcarbamoyltransferase complex dimerization subunit type 1 TsaB [Henriciella sp.]
MIILGIHTAGPACDLAIWRDGEVLAEAREPMVRGQDARLPELTKSLLDEAGYTFTDISRYAVVTGPGSFTGIRVGVAFGRGLSLATGAPCIGVTSLEAAQPAGQQGSAIVALAAQKRPPDITFWAQTFRSGMATAIANEMRADELVQLMSDRPHLLFGDQDALSRCFPNDSIHAAAPSAARAAAVAAELDPDQRPARPTYARSPDAALPASKPKQ